MKKLDAIAMAILDALQRDGRLPNVALAKAVGLRPPPCAERVKDARGIDCRTSQLVGSDSNYWKQRRA